MPAAVTETVTIINNSGKIISTGKHIFGIFEKAKNSYHEKKAALKAERAYRDATRGKTHTFEIPRRAHTFDVSASSHRDARDANSLVEEDDARRRSCDDTASRASSRRSHKSRRSSSSSHHNPKPSKSRRNTAPIAEEEDEKDEKNGRRNTSHSCSPANRLTADNLRALGAAAATATVAETAAKGVAKGVAMERGEPPPPRPSHEAPMRESILHRTASEPTTVRASQFQPSPSSAPPPPPPTAAASQGKKPRTRSPSPASDAGARSSDDDLAYGYIPPNLANRTDLDPKPRPQAQPRSLSAPAIPIISHPEDGSESSSSESDESDETLSPHENEAKALAERIEDLLDEAQCIHHSATAIISHLQEKPEAAAAVALTLAELSAVVAKMSPAFLTTLKGAAPVVFGLLASPHFLVAAGLAVGVTVVMFGGLKILKRIVERNSERMAFEARAMPNGPGMVLGEVESVKAESVVADAPPPSGRAALLLGPPVSLPEPAPTLALTSTLTTPPPADEAVPVAQLEEVIQKELSGIERWRRGIPTAVDHDDEREAAAAKIDDELLSPEAREAVMGRAKINPAPVLEANNMGDDTASVSGRSTRSGRSHRSERSTKSWSTYRSPPTSWGSDVPDRRGSRKHRDDDSEWWDGSSVGSVRSSRTHRSDKTSRTDKSHRSSTSRREKHHSKSDKDGGLRVIEEIRGDGSDASEPKPAKPAKEKKKDGILKSMFRRKLKEDREGQKVLVA